MRPVVEFNGTEYGEVIGMTEHEIEVLLRDTVEGPLTFALSQTLADLDEVAYAHLAKDTVRPGGLLERRQKEALIRCEQVRRGHVGVTDMPPFSCQEKHEKSEEDSSDQPYRLEREVHRAYVMKQRPETAPKVLLCWCVERKP